MNSNCGICGNPAKFYSSLDSKDLYCSKQCFVNGKYDKDKEELTDDPFVYRYSLSYENMDYAIFKQSLMGKDPKEIAFNLAAAYYYEHEPLKTTLLEHFARYLNSGEPKFSMLLIRTNLISQDYIECYKWLDGILPRYPCLFLIEVCWKHKAWKTLAYIKTRCAPSEQEKARLWIANKIAQTHLDPEYMRHVLDDKQLYWVVLNAIFDQNGRFDDAYALLRKLNLRLFDMAEVKRIRGKARNRSLDQISQMLSDTIAVFKLSDN